MSSNIELSGAFKGLSRVQKREVEAKTIADRIEADAVARRIEGGFALTHEASQAVVALGKVEEMFDGTPTGARIGHVIDGYTLSVSGVIARFVRDK